MLQKIRSHIQGWIAGVVIGIVALTFVFWGVESYEHSSAPDHQVLAKVDGSKITTADVDDLYQQLQSAQQQHSEQPLTISQQQQLRSIALQQLINGYALFHAAQRDGFQVSIDQIKQMIMGEREFQINGRFSEQRFQQVLTANDLTPQKFFTQMQQAFTGRQVFDGIMSSAFVLRNEMAQIYALVKQTRSFGYFVLPASQFSVQNKIADQQIEDYYHQHQDEFKAPEQVKISYLQLSPQEISKTVVIDPAEVKQYYQDHVIDYSSPTRWQVDSLVVKMPVGANDKSYQNVMSSLAQLRSQLQPTDQLDQLSKHVIGSQVQTNQWLSSDHISQSVRQALDKLKVGEVSLPFYSDQGPTIIRLKAITPGTQKDFASVSNDIETLLRHQHVDRILNDKSQKLSELTYTNPTSLSIAAQTLHIPVQTSDWVTRHEKHGMFANQKLLLTIFSDDVLQQGDNSEPVELDDGSVIVVRVDQHHISSIKPLAEVKTKIEAQLQQQLIQKQAGLQAFKIQKALQDGVAQSVLAERYHLTWQQENNIARDNKQLASAVLSAVFDLVPSASQPHPVTTTLLNHGDYAIIQLQNIQLGEYKNASVTDSDQLHTALTNYWGQTDYQLYSQSVLAHAKVKYSKQVDNPN